jgi:N-formylglutamate amidohydrolase
VIGDAMPDLRDTRPMNGEAATGTTHEEPAFALSEPAAGELPVLVASAHSSRAYPDSFIRSSRLDLAALRRSEDSFVEELFGDVPALGVPLLQALFPRVYCDANREPWELDPAMFSDPLPGWCNVSTAKVRAGFGTIPRFVTAGQPIYRDKLPFSEAQRRVNTCWQPYHAALADQIDRMTRRHGLCLLLDCHSMPRLPELGRHRPQPDIVLGDAFGTSCGQAFTAEAQRVLEAAGLSVRRNDPYAGGYVTRHYGRPQDKVHVLQLEIDRSLYMDEALHEKLPSFEAVRELMTGLVRHLAAMAKKKAVPKHRQV